MVKFSQMEYQRPDLEKLKAEMANLVERLKSAESYAQARETFLEADRVSRHTETMGTLANIRHSIDIRDSYYDGEVKFWNVAGPELQEYQQAWNRAMLNSPFRADFSQEFGDLMFVNAEIALKTFSPDIIELMQKENDLTQEYEKLLASAQIPFEGGACTLSQLTPFKRDPSRERRAAASSYFVERIAAAGLTQDALRQLVSSHGQIAQDVVRNLPRCKIKSVGSFHASLLPLPRSRHSSPASLRLSRSSMSPLPMTIMSSDSCRTQRARPS